MRRHVSSLALLLCAGCFNAHPIDEGSSGTRLELIAWEPEDGTGIHATSFFDRELGVECRYSAETATGRYRCRPRPMTQLLFLDSGCRETVTPSCLAEAHAMVSAWRRAGPSPGCGVPAPHYVASYRVGESVTAARTWRLGIDGACEETDGSFTDLVRLSELPDEMFVAAEESVRPRDDDERLGDWIVTGEDGSEWRLGDYDHELGAACFGVLGTGPIPCIVGVSSPRVVSGSCGELYGWIASGTSECPARPPTLFHRADDGSCGGPGEVHVFRASAPLSADEAEACIAEPRPPGSYVTLNPADDAVAWLPNEARGTGRLRAFAGRPSSVTYLSRFGLYLDTELNIECNPDALHGVMRCLPSAAVGTSYLYEDPGCTLPAVYLHEETGCSRFAYALQDEDDGDTCTDYQARQYYRVGSRLERAYEASSGGCEEWVPPSPEAYAARLEAVPDETFARFRRR
ncbi:MAG: hypothetical protein VYE22_15035 [Myxococcota bacterium]|nr:hypothetical protein [Myxococcota bacterium]